MGNSGKVTVTDRLIVGISGATGIVYGVRLLEALRATPVETHLVVSNAGLVTLRYETDLARSDLLDLADVVHAQGDLGAAISSGSFPTMGMVIAPCSVKSLAEIAHGNTSALLTRAADVVLKERRRLVLLVRETPLHTGHLRSMTAASEVGAIVMPPVPAFYTRPATINDIVDHTVARVLDLFGIANELSPRWTGGPAPAADDG